MYGDNKLTHPPMPVSVLVTGPPVLTGGPPPLVGGVVIGGGAAASKRRLGLPRAEASRVAVKRTASTARLEAIDLCGENGASQSGSAMFTSHKQGPAVPNTYQKRFSTGRCRDSMQTSDRGVRDNGTSLLVYNCRMAIQN